MDKLEFRANDIAISDHGYIHFSTSKNNPEIYLLFQRKSNKPKIYLKNKLEKIELFPENYTLEINSFYLHLIFISELNNNSHKDIKVLFEVGVEKLSEIKNRLSEVYSCEVKS